MKAHKSILRQCLDLISVITTLVILASCAASAPLLPDDTTAINKQHSVSISDFSSQDAAMSCDAIKIEQSGNTVKIAQDNKAIESNRRLNQTAGYLGGLLVLPLIATEGNYSEKDDITALQQRQDVLRKLAIVKRC